MPSSSCGIPWSPSTSITLRSTNCRINGVISWNDRFVWAFPSRIVWTWRQAYSKQTINRFDCASRTMLSKSNRDTKCIFTSVRVSMSLHELIRSSRVTHAHFLNWYYRHTRRPVFQASMLFKKWDRQCILFQILLKRTCYVQGHTDSL